MAVKDLTQAIINDGNKFDSYVDLKSNEGIVFRLMTRLDSLEALDLRGRFRYQTSNVWYGKDKPEGLPGQGLSLPVLGFDDDKNQHLDPMTWLSNNKPDAFVKPGTKERINITTAYEWMIAIQSTEPFSANTPYTPWDAAKYDFQDEPKVIRLKPTQYNTLFQLYKSLVDAGRNPLEEKIMFTKTKASPKDKNYVYTFLPQASAKGKDALPQSEALDVAEFIPYSNFASQEKLLAKIGIVLPYSNPEMPVEEDGWSDETEE